MAETIFNDFQDLADLLIPGPDSFGMSTTTYPIQIKYRTLANGVSELDAPTATDTPVSIDAFVYGETEKRADGTQVATGNMIALVDARTITRPEIDDLFVIDAKDHPILSVEAIPEGPIKTVYRIKYRP